jgi:O-glycosyl hydrolase
MSRTGHGFAAAALSLLMWPLSLAGAAEGIAILRVDADKPRQVMEGFGATTLSLVYEGPLGDTLDPDLRKRAIEAAYGKVRLNAGNLEIGFFQLADHAHAAGWNGYRTFGAEAMKKKVVDLAAPLGFSDFVLCPKIRVGGGNTRLRDLRKVDYPKFLAACADQIAMAAKFWREQSGTMPRFIMPFNEPTSGNRELDGGGTKEVVEIIRAIGHRLRAEGFKDTKLVVPCEETVAHSLAVAEAILSDADARPFVGAIGYHCYPYGSPYASVPRILHSSALGKPDPHEIELRGSLRDLGRKYGVPLWMMEVSHSEAPALSFDALRGRAIHIHDEFVYADASAYYGMNSIWDLTSHRDHFRGRGGDAKDALYTEQDTIVLIDNDRRTVEITGMGYAIGHYARWVRRGAVRLETESDDPLLQATAFRDDANKRLVVVAINNAQEPRNLQLQTKGLALSGTVSGEQSTARAFWQQTTPFQVNSHDEIRVRLPAMSVTTLAVPLAK